MKAIIFNLLAWVMLPIMDGIAKYLSSDIPVLQITWARYFFTVFFTLPIIVIIIGLKGSPELVAEISLVHSLIFLIYFPLSAVHGLNR